MLSFAHLMRVGVFMATGYVCAGTAVAVLGGIPLWTAYLESSYVFVSIFIVAEALIAGAFGILLMRYLVNKAGAKAVYEQDILIYIIGMLFMALTMNSAMFVVGLFIACAALPVFFYENFNRQVSVIRSGSSHFVYLAGWALGPIVVFLALIIFNDYGLLVSRLIFAHFIVIGFWIWVQRLNNHEQYDDAPTVLLQDLSAIVKTDAKPQSAEAPAPAVVEPAKAEDEVKETADEQEEQAPATEPKTPESKSESDEKSDSNESVQRL